MTEQETRKAYHKAKAHFETVADWLNSSDPVEASEYEHSDFVDARAALGEAFDAWLKAYKESQ